MLLTDSIETVDLGLLIEGNLVVGDLHIGYEEMLNKSGQLVPRYQFEDIVQRFEKILDLVTVERIILNGDIKHQFGEISKQEWNETTKLLTFLKRKANVVIVKGNHDTLIEPIASKIDVSVVDYFDIGDVRVVHGHEIGKIPSSIKTVVIGHEHAAISISDGLRSELYKCFLKGKHDKYDLIVMPSFMNVTVGSDVSKEKLLSPFLSDGVLDYDVFVIGKGTCYHFGTVYELMKK